MPGLAVGLVLSVDSDYLALPSSLISKINVYIGIHLATVFPLEKFLDKSVAFPSVWTIILLFT